MARGPWDRYEVGYRPIRSPFARAVKVVALLVAFGAVGVTVGLFLGVGPHFFGPAPTGPALSVPVAPTSPPQPTETATPAGADSTPGPTPTPAPTATPTPSPAPTQCTMSPLTMLTTCTTPAP